MTVKGLDYAWSKPSPTAIWNGGYRFVSRYLSWSSSGSKVINKTELNALRAKGIMVALNWEYAAGDMKNGASAGKSHATEAVRLAKNLGYPKGCTIYFSCDFNASSSQLSGPVTQYLKAAAPIVRGAGYRLGIYGGYGSVKYAFDHKLVDDGWQTYAWSGGRWDSRAHLRQVHNGVKVGGADCDIDEIHGTVYFMGGTPAAAASEEDDVSAKDVWTYTIASPALGKTMPAGDWVKQGYAALQQVGQVRAEVAELRAREEGQTAIITALADALKTGGGNIDTAAVLSKLDGLAGQVADLTAKLAAAEAERDKLRTDLAEALGGTAS